MTSAPITSETPVGEAIVAALDQAGVEFVLAMPGGYMRPVLIALHNHPRIRVILVREESIGTTMAEAYGRVKGKPIVVLGQGQWLAANAGQGLLEAHLGSSPVVVLTDMTDGGPYSHHSFYQSGAGDYGGWNARESFSGVTKRVFVSRYPAQAVQHTQLALKHACVGEPGPVVVAYDLLALGANTVGPEAEPQVYQTDKYLNPPLNVVDEGELARAVELIGKAKRPVILGGNGVRLSGATSHLLALASSIDAPIATTASGKGVAPERGELGVGTIGTYGVGAANALVGDSDLIVAVGTKIGAVDTIQENPKLIDPSRQTIVQIDVEPLNIGWTQPVSCGLVGDAKFVIDRLVDALDSRSDRLAGRETTAAERVAAMRKKYPDFVGEEFEAEDLPMWPQRIIRTMEEVLPADTIVTCDAGENRLFMMHWFRDAGLGGYLQPAGSGGMGYAVRSAMGARIAAPERVAVAVCGDGGFAMNLHSLMTAVQEKIPIVVVVFNNAALGWVVHAMGDKAVAADLRDFDHAAIARSIGCEGHRIDTPGELRDVLKKAIEIQDRPFVIDVPTSMNVSVSDVHVLAQLFLQSDEAPRPTKTL
ncbi:MAG: thiamine pyrophosphate-binding protein [Microthrixaceae bacterium]